LSQNRGTQVPLLQVSVQPQVGVQVFVGHIPFVHLPPPGQPQAPPHPSPAPQVPSLGHLGVQQLPPYSTEPLAQPQVLPQPSDIPARLPFAGQFGVQQAPL
jgi:hypothetical protein